MSKERPIIFSAPLIPRILDGSKTMTRRIVKPQTLIPSDWGEWSKEAKDAVIRNRCPYGVPGDRLKVKEDICAKFVGHDAYISYAADGELVTDRGAVISWGYRRKAISGRFMRPVYSRLTLEIVSVRVERVQEITEEDAKMEGAERMALDDLGNSWRTHKRGFQALWESIYGDGSWEQNPWVWVIEFGGSHESHH